MKRAYHISKLIFLVCLLFFLLQSCSTNDDSIATSNPTTSDTFQPVATENIVMYEINPSAFSSSKNFQGITNRLDNIKALGINTI